MCRKGLELLSVKVVMILVFKCIVILVFLFENIFLRIIYVCFNFFYYGFIELII